MPHPAGRNRETFALQKIDQSGRVAFPAAVVSALVEVDTIAPSFRGGEGVSNLARRSGCASASNKTRFSFYCAINAMLEPSGASSSTISSLAASASIFEDAEKWSSASHALKAGSLLSPLRFQKLAKRGRQLLASLASTETVSLAGLIRQAALISSAMVCPELIAKSSADQLSILVRGLNHPRRSLCGNGTR